MTMTPPRPLPPGAAPVSAADCVAVDYFAVQRVADEFGIDYNKLCAAIRALRQEGEPVAWWKFNADGKRIAITDDELAAQPDWIKKKWASAHPLYALTPSPKGPTTP
jgi:hypothetical protein